jgi:hypothetical protein
LEFETPVIELVGVMDEEAGGSEESVRGVGAGIGKSITYNKRP